MGGSRCQKKPASHEALNVVAGRIMDTCGVTRRTALKYLADALYRNSVIETIIDQVRYTRATGSHDDRRSTENG